MASITIRQLDEPLKRRLRIRAAEHGRSMEDEVREILRSALPERTLPEKLGTAIHKRFGAERGVDLEIPKREAQRGLPELD